MRNDMFNWLLRKKQTTPVTPEVEGQTAHAPAEAEAPVEEFATAMGAQAPFVEEVEADQPAAQTIELGTIPAPPPEIEITGGLVEAYDPDPTAEAGAEPIFSPVSQPPGPTGRIGEAPAATPSKSCARPRQPFTAGVSRPKPLLVLQNAAGGIDLRADLEVIEHSGRQVRRGTLIAVRADGRRLLAKLGGADRIRAYTLRRDGIYRLEGANDARAPVLELAN